MARFTSSVSPKGQVTIPAEYRERLGIETRDRVTFELHEDFLVVRPVGSPVDRLFGSVTPTGKEPDWERIRREAWEDAVAERLEDELDG